MMHDMKFNESLDQATDAVVNAFGWMMPMNQETLAEIMIQLDNAISAVLSDYAPTTLGDTPTPTGES